MVRIPSLAALVLLAACSSGAQKPAELAPAKLSTLSVNTYLWRAALETIAFMPIAQADSGNGVILTDWYANPQTPTERVKVSVFILDKDLRADALTVSANRQENRGGAWVDAPLRADTVQKLEEAILERARTIRQSVVAER
ncbi:MAG: DUF3576 domain-containing protein [Sphingomonadales bacterium]|nr:MAG: DUF3576 domain-containing protein [Sphingomonadales bacterium]